MLKQLRKFERTSKLLILGFIGLMAVSLVLFFRPSGNSSVLDPAKSPEVLAKVNGDEITVGEFATSKQNFERQFSQYGSQFNLAQMGFSDQRILDGLIMKRVTEQEATRLGLGASEAEIKERIAKLFSDASGKFLLTDSSGKFDMSRYQERVGDIPAFERSIGQDIAREKLEAFITASVRVSEDEVKEDYKKKNTTFDLTYVVVTPEKIAATIQPTEDELKTYFEQHKNDYHIDVPQKKIRYVFISQEKSGEKLQISDKELHDEYDKLELKYKQAGVKVQQIVLKVANDKLDAAVKTKADQLVSKARGMTGSATEEAFADLAKGNSEDPATAQNGGRVAGIVKKNPNKPDDPYQKVLDLEPGNVTDPIKYKNAYYILRRGEDVPKTFEVAKEELKVSLRNRRGYTAAQKVAQHAQDLLKDLKDPQKVAQQLAAEANMKPEEIVRETGFIKPGDDVKDVGVSQQFEEAIAPLNNPNDVGERVGIKNGFAIPMMVEKREPRIPEFSEVRDKVLAAVKLERAKSSLEAKAKELITNAKSPTDFKAAAARLGLEAKTESAYKIATPLGDAGSSVLLDDAIYAMNTAEVSKAPVKLNENFFVFGVNKRTDADLAEFAKQRDTLMQSALDDRKRQVFDDYLSAAQQRLQRDGRIKIYQDVLDRITEEEPSAAPAPRPRSRLPVSR